VPRTEELPTVSVVLPFLDPQPFFLEAIASVLAQTYEDWELLLVDDGSNDGSGEVATAFTNLYPGRIRCLRHDGGGTRGMSASRNLGLSEARGSYVAFLDADDVWYPAKLQEQVTLLSAHPDVAMVYGSTEWWYSWTGNPSDRARDFVQELGIPVDRVLEPPALVTALLRREHPTMTPALVRRDSLMRAGGFEDVFHGLYEDQAACVKIGIDQRVLVSSACWYRWRQHPRSSCAVSLATGNYAQARQLFLEWLDEFLVAHEIVDSEPRHALEQARSGESVAPDRPGLRRRSGAHAHRLARRLRRLRRPISFGDLNRTEPFSRTWGYERGTPVDRFYIEGFLAEHASDVRGRVLEVGGDDYTWAFGAERVLTSDVLHVDASNPKATIVADLMSAPEVPADSFDCVICTQTLQFIEDPARAVGTLHRLLAPGGVLLATFPGISQMGSDEWHGSWWWRFTPRSARMLLAERFGESSVQVRSYGNVTAAVAFLHGLPVEDVPLRYLTRHDPSYDLVLTVRAVKQA
jgi:glycosyltransferase involved in cell wall biosynthesis